MTSEIKSEIKLVSPELAKQYLLCNEQNRRIREGWVNYLAFCMRNQEWKLTHQGIAFSDNGRLLDGQHRLLAVIKSKTPARMMVSSGWDESVFSAIDNGMHRSDEDRTGIPKRLAECAKFFLGIMGYAGTEPPRGRSTGSTCARSTPAQIISYSNVIRDFYDLLMTKGSSTTTTLFASVPGRCAAIANLMRGEDIDYVIEMYQNLVLAKSENYVPIAHSAVRQVTYGSVSSKGGGQVRLDNFIRFLPLFEKKNASIQKLILRDRDERIAQIRAELMPWFLPKETRNTATPLERNAPKTEARVAEQP